MQRSLGPVASPRHLLIRWADVEKTKVVDYFSVPDLLGRRRESVAVFLEIWNRRLMPVEAVSTRTVEGRRALVKARVHALSSQLARNADRKTVWE